MWMRIQLHAVTSAPLISVWESTSPSIVALAEESVSIGKRVLSSFTGPSSKLLVRLTIRTTPSAGEWLNYAGTLTAATWSWSEMTEDRCIRKISRLCVLGVADDANKRSRMARLGMRDDITARSNKESFEKSMECHKK